MGGSLEKNSPQRAQRAQRFLKGKREIKCFHFYVIAHPPCITPQKKMIRRGRRGWLREREKDKFSFLL
jgi:hypothetical protein